MLPDQKAMTWGELAEKLKALTPQQLDTNVTIRDGDEFIPACNFGFMDEKDECSDVLDLGHPYLQI